MIDEKDEQIISMLQENGRITFSKIAEEVGLSNVAVMKRVNRLVKEGVIQKFTTIVSPMAIGKDITALLLVNVGSITKRKDVVQVLTRLADVYEIYESANSYHIVAKIRCSNEQELDSLINRIKKINNVRETNTILLDPIKEEYGPILKKNATVDVQQTAGGTPKITLENSMVRVVLDCSHGGRIVEFTNKYSGINRAHEIGMLMDTFIEVGWLPALVERESAYTVLKDIGETVSVVLSRTLRERTLNGIKIEKTVSLSQDTLLKVEYRFINPTNEAKTLSPWICNYGKANWANSEKYLLFVPLDKPVEEPYAYNGPMRDRKMWKRELPWTDDDIQLFKTEHGTFSKFPITKGWAAYWETTTDEVWTVIWEHEKVRMVKRVFDSTYFSLEIILNPITLKPGEEERFRMLLSLEKGGWYIAPNLYRTLRKGSLI